MAQEERDKELGGLLQDDGKPKIKAGNRENVRRKLWLSEVITFRRMDDEGLIPPGCEWRVERKKIRRKLLQELVNRCPIPCVIDYVYDNTGAAIWLEDIQLKGKF